MNHNKTHTTHEVGHNLVKRCLISVMFHQNDSCENLTLNGDVDFHLA